nr:MAG TPA: hypothetical protein [Caudoviricetes sp.]
MGAYTLRPNPPISVPVHSTTKPDFSFKIS